MKPDLELKTLLAGWFTGIISLRKSHRIHYEFRWVRSGNAIKPTEWDHIVRLVEEKLTDNQKSIYMEILSLQSDFCPLPTEEIIEWSHIFDYAHATWQQRTTALYESGVMNKDSSGCYERERLKQSETCNHTYQENSTICTKCGT